MNSLNQAPRKAMVFAAGLGTRLRPFTDSRPKALVEVNGKPLLFHAIRKLEAAGIQEVVVNVHHYATMIREYLACESWKCEILISDETECLLDTGGGLRKAAPLLMDDRPVLISNVDILTDLDIHSFYQTHLESKALVTLAVRDRSTSRKLLFDSQNELIGWTNTQTGEYKWPGIAQDDYKALAFSGVHLFSPGFLDLIPNSENVFSIIDTWLTLSPNHRIKGYDHTRDFWLDVGKPESLPKAENWLKSH